MNRRELLNRLSIVVAGTFYYSSCNFTQEDVLSAYSNLGISSGEKELLQSINAVMIPSDPKIKGASDLALEDFILVVVNDCLNSEKRDRFVRGLRSFEEYRQEVASDELDAFSSEDAESLITAVLNAKGDQEDDHKKDAKFFLETTKELLIQGYMKSEYVMTEIMPYDMAPGGFSGKVKVIEGEKINIYG